MIWRTISLGEISESVRYGVTASANFERVGPKFLRITDIQDNTVDWDRVPWCDCDENVADESRLQSGDIVFARTGATTGKSFLVRECPADAVFASYLIRVRCGPEVDPAYLIQFFKTPDYWAQVFSSARGAAQAGVNASVLKSLRVPLPPLAVQRRISSVLEAVEHLIAQRRTSMEHLNALAAAALSKTLEASPAGEKTLCVGDVAVVQGGLQVTGARKKHEREIPYLRVANVYRGYLLMDEVKNIRITDAELARTALQRNDVLIVEGHGNPEEVGRCALWDASIEVCTHQNHLIRVRFDESRVLPRFACDYLNSSVGRRHLHRSGKTTSGLNTISVSDVRSAPLVIPSRDAQAGYLALVDQIDAMRARYLNQLQELDVLYASLQYRAFRGEL
ncbi:MAG TPA: hypothetical protein DIT18_17750 [Pseudomonas sp.]|nr:hypothetical protein [Pseudomonas sp.]